MWLSTKIMLKANKMNQFKERLKSLRDRVKLSPPACLNLAPTLTTMLLGHRHLIRHLLV